MALLLQPLGLSPSSMDSRTTNTGLFRRSTLVLHDDCRPLTPSLHRRACALRTSSEGAHNFVIPTDVSLEKKVRSELEEERNSNYPIPEEGSESMRWFWEERILEDTVPLVGFVRTILHTGTYQSGDRLSSKHESFILEKLLPFHPRFEKKIGCGIDYITIGYHPIFRKSRCFFIVREDGERVDFSYWKCIKGLIRHNYPSYADSFIHRHFRHGKHMASSIAPDFWSEHPVSRHVLWMASGQPMNEDLQAVNFPKSEIVARLDGALLFKWRYWELQCKQT